jgi:hypothetical protein
MDAMGPEAALLSTRLAAYRSERFAGNLEYPNEHPLYVQASVVSRAGDSQNRTRRDASHGLWARAAEALRLRAPPEPGAADAPAQPASLCESLGAMLIVPSIAVPEPDVGRLGRDYHRPARQDAELSIAALPLQGAVHR